jgi:DNA-binding transcriptional LysR family regulator
MLNPFDLRAFSRIAQLRSVSAAARELKMPKSSVSRSLARLEEALGVPLLERSTRHLRLTDAGTLFLPHATRLLSDMEEAETALRDFAGTARGTLRVSAPLAYVSTLLTPLLPGFLLRYPEVRVVLDLNHRNVDMLAEDIDLVIRMGPLADSSLVARRLPPVHMWLCASPQYVARKGMPVRVADLLVHEVIDRIDGPNEWVFDLPDQGQVRITLHPRAVSPEPAVGMALILGGAGIGLLPSFMAEPAIAEGGLLRIFPESLPQTVEAHALYPSHRSLSAKVRVFIDALVTHLSPPQP